MDFLGGEGATFLQSVFANVYKPGTIYAIENVYDDYGNITPITVEYDCACQVDRMDEKMMAQEGAADSDRKIIVLTNTSAPMNTDVEITTTQPGYAGVRFMVQSVGSDPAFSHWILRGRRKP